MSEAFSELLARFSGILDVADDAVISLDKQQRITLFNKGAERIFGYHKEQVLGQPLDMLLPPGAVHVHHRHIQRFTESPETARPMGARQEIFGRRRDGSIFPAEASISKLRLGDQVVLTAILRDISERKRAEAELTRSRARFSGIVDIADDAILSVDEQQHITLYNKGAERIFGFREDEVLGRPLDMLLPHGAMETHHTHVERFLTSPDTARRMGARQEIFGRRKDGTVFPAEASISKLRLGEETVLTAILRDVTERKKFEVELKEAEAALRRANEDLERRVRERTAELEASNRQLKEKADELGRSNDELERFAYVASHDLQEPLRMVASFTQLLEKRYAGHFDDAGREFMGFIVDGARRMQQLINDLLAFSRVGTRGKAFAPVSTESALQEALANLKLCLEENGAEVTHDPLPQVFGDDTQLAQLFQNLVGNALKFRRQEPPRVHISAQRSNGVWHFAVQDNGIGIEPEYYERIFVIFQRLHVKTEYPGTGIGLAICKKIVERHGGQIWVESRPGAGTTFHFTLQAT